VWDDANVVHFIAICKEEISNENRPLGFFNSTGWKNFVEKFEAKTEKKLTKLQLKNTTMMIVKPEFREIFSLLQTKEGRLDLLEREHEKEMRRV
jgi:hypothetical protein